MNIDKITTLLQNNIDTINTPEFLSKILNMHNNLVCFDSLNRMLIQLQYENAFDLRSYEEWEMCGRSVKNESVPIWVVSPHYEYTYVYGDNEDKEADISDLNTLEKNKAIELNIIKRKSNLKNIKTLAVYDIRQTKKIKGQQFKVAKPILNNVSVLKLFKSLTDSKIVKCDEYYYSTSDNTLYMPDVEYRELANIVAKSLVKYFLDNIDIANQSEDKTRILSEYTEYGLSTLLRGNTQTNISKCSDITELIQIISIAESILEKVVNNIEYSGQMNLSSGAVQNIDVLRKAEVVLEIFTAVSTSKKIGDV